MVWKSHNLGKAVWDLDNRHLTANLILTNTAIAKFNFEYTLVPYLVDRLLFMQVAQNQAENYLCEEEHDLVKKNVAFDKMLHHHDLNYYS